MNLNQKNIEMRAYIEVHVMFFADEEVRGQTERAWLCAEEGQ